MTITGKKRDALHLPRYQELDTREVTEAPDSYEIQVENYRKLSALIGSHQLDTCMRRSPTYLQTSNPAKI